MSLREALANAVLHGNRQDPRKKVRVCCACEAARGILIVVKDEGEGFNPEKVPSPLAGENIRSEHGRGIYLLNLLMDGSVLTAEERRSISASGPRPRVDVRSAGGVRDSMAQTMPGETHLDCAAIPEQPFG